MDSFICTCVAIVHFIGCWKLEAFGIIWMSDKSDEPASVFHFGIETLGTLPASDLVGTRTVKLSDR
jgi:hypothetical protein